MAKNNQYPTPLNDKGVLNRLREDEAGFLALGLLLRSRIIRNLGLGAVAGLIIGPTAFLGGVNVSSENSNEGSQVEIDTRAILSRPIQEYVSGLVAANGQISATDVLKIKVLGKMLFDGELPWTEEVVKFLNNVPIEYRISGDDKLDTHEFIANPDGTVTANIFINKLHLTANYIDGFKFSDGDTPEDEIAEPLVVVDNPLFNAEDNLNMDKQFKMIREACKIAIDDAKCNEWLDPYSNTKEIADAKAIASAKWVLLNIASECQETDSNWRIIKEKLADSIYKMVADSRGISLEEAKRITTIRFVDDSGNVTSKTPDFTNTSLYNQYVLGGHMFDTVDAKPNEELGRNVDTSGISIKCTTSDNAGQDNLASTGSN